MPKALWVRWFERAILPALVELNPPADTPLHKVLPLLCVEELTWLEALVTFVFVV
jgi:hypothetical protein